MSVSTLIAALKPKIELISRPLSAKASFTGSGLAAGRPRLPKPAKTITSPRSPGTLIIAYWPGQRTNARTVKFQADVLTRSGKQALATAPSMAWGGKYLI